MCLQVVYRTVVPSHVANKRDIIYENTLNIVGNFVYVVLDLQEKSNCVTSLYVMHWPTYHTEKQYKEKINSSGGRV